MNNKERIIGLVKSVNRQGIDQVIDYLNTSDYFTRGCYEHHTEPGGLAQHALEVYDAMCRHAGSLPPESLVVAALFHDLGKTKPGDGCVHGQRSIAILEGCGFALTDDERDAIANHHDKVTAGVSSLGSFLCEHNLLGLLSTSDMKSTGRWKEEHSN